MINKINFFFLRFTGKKITTINLGSYNYLGFANNNGEISDNVINSIKTNGIATASTTQEFGKYIQGVCVCCFFLIKYLFQVL